MLKYVFYVWFFFVKMNKIKCDSEVKSSLTFVIDSSGSMHFVIDQVKRDVNSIFDTVMNSSSSQIEDFVLVTFDESVTLRTVTKDRQTFMDALKSFKVEGGGSCPELAMSGIELALSNSRQGSSLYIFTDASAEDYNKFAKVEALSEKMQSQLVFVLTDDCGSRDEDDYLVYQKLAKATQGQVFSMTKYDIDKILKYVKNSISSRKNIITSKTFPAGYGHKFNVDVDGDTKELVIAVSGINPLVGVTDSDGAEIPTEDITRLSEVAVVKVLGVKPGVYKVEVGSESETNVVVSGTTTVHFQHGFSVFEPTAITDTATRPIPGEKSYLSIKLAAEGKVELQSIQLLDMDDNVVLEKPLKVLNEADNLYTTDPIYPPNQMFRIAIKGYDKESNTFLTRLSLTPIKPQDSTLDVVEMAPAVSISGGDKIEAEVGKPFQIKCKISGYPKPDIAWESNDPSALFHKETVVEISYELLSVLHIKNVTTSYTYTCKASNKLGTNFKRIVVQVKREHVFNVQKLSKDTAIEYKKPAQLFCKVDAFPPATVHWYKDHRPLVSDPNAQLSADNSTLTIRSMEPYVAGDYICEIRNEFNRKINPFTVAIIGVEKPKINKNEYLIERLKHSSVDIRCHAFRGKPKPTFTWFYSEEFSPFAKYSKLAETTDTIHINDVGVEHSGSYRCKATNFIGRDVHDIELIVEYPPEWSRRAPALVAGGAGEAVKLACLAHGAPPPAVTWRRAGAALPPAGYTLFRDGSLRFIATLDRKGQYECEARNEHGSIIMQTLVDVNVPVNIETPKGSKKSVMVGASLELPCKAGGFPKPKILWIFYSKESGFKQETLVPCDSSGSVYLNRIQQRQDGFYTCVAKNVASSKNITYTVEVTAPPSITYTKKEFTAVIEDRILRIPCNATGNPNPTIAWKKDGLYIPSGLKYAIEEGTLIIKNIDMEAAGSYTCEASNKYASVHEIFEAIVKLYPDPGTIKDTIWLEETRPAVLSCNVPHQKIDRLRWFKNGVIISRKELIIKTVTRYDAGVFTCRVSTAFGKIQTYSVKVEVGSKPDFVLKEKEEIKFQMGDFASLSCDTSGKPKPQIQWLHDDVPLDVTSFTHEVEMTGPRDKGRYTCIVSNTFGSVQRDFKILSYECKLDIKKDFGGNEPLMLIPSLDVRKFKVIDGHIVLIPAGEIIALYCPKTFNKIPSRKIMVECENEKTFKYSDRSFLYSDLKCRERVNPVVKKMRRRCTKGDSVMLNVGFKIPANVMPEYDIEWFGSGSAVDSERLYDCGRQSRALSSALREDFHARDGCCFARRQLVSARDVAPGLPQAAAYSRLNVAPHWSTCNSQNWDEVEERIRSLVKVLRRKVQVWTGTASALQLRDANSSLTNIFLNDGHTDYQVPTYFWKVVYDPVGDASLAVVQVNVPDLTLKDAWRYRLCHDVCHEVDWMHFGKTWRSLARGYTYCCQLDDFVRSFDLPGIFPPRSRLLKNILT